MGDKCPRPSARTSGDKKVTAGRALNARVLVPQEAKLGVPWCPFLGTHTHRMGDGPEKERMGALGGGGLPFVPWALEVTSLTASGHWGGDHDGGGEGCSVFSPELPELPHYSLSGKCPSLGLAVGVI